jgi:hypothetical protein
MYEISRQNVIEIGQYINVKIDLYQTNTTVAAALAANCVYYSQHALPSGVCGASPPVKANYRTIIYYFHAIWIATYVLTLVFHIKVSGKGGVSHAVK